MKTWTALAVLLVLGIAPARAEDEDRVTALQGEIEFLELQRDVDKTLLREMMIEAGHARMKQVVNPPDLDREKKQALVAIESLESLIRDKRDALVHRAIVLKKKGAELSALEKADASRQKGARQTRPSKPKEAPGDEKEVAELTEKLEETQIDVLLLQAQTQLYVPPLNEALEAVANAEFAAGDDRSKQEAADAARKRFEKIRGRYVEHSKKLSLAQSKLAELRTQLGQPAMGGMAGMGGGFR